MKEKEELKGEVIDCCLQLFIEQGIRSVSIEDIVRACNVSKKSLYELFGNKEGIIHSALITDCKSHQNKLESVTEDAENAIDEMFLLQNFFSQRFKNLNPALIYDLTKYYNEIHRESDVKKEANFLQFMENNLLRGIKEGYYRKEIPLDVVSKLWITKIGMVRDQEVFPIREYPMHEITKQLVELHLRSIATPEGVKLIEKHLISIA